MRNLSFKGPHQSKQASNEHLCPEGMFSIERPSSAMSEMSIHVGDHDVPSRAESRMENVPLGDAISHGNLNMASSFSSRRGSEQQAVGKSIASWMSKLEDNDDFIADDYSKHPVEEYFDRRETPKAEEINISSRNEMTPILDSGTQEENHGLTKIRGKEEKSSSRPGSVNKGCDTKEIEEESIRIPWQAKQKMKPDEEKEEKSSSRSGSVNKGSDSKVEEVTKGKPWQAKQKAKPVEEQEEKAASRPGSVNRGSDSKVEEEPKRKPWQAKPKGKPEEEMEHKAASRPGSVNKGSDSKEVEEESIRKPWQAQQKAKPEEEKEDKPVSRPGSVYKGNVSEVVEEEPKRKPWQAKQKAKPEEEKEEKSTSRPGSVNKGSDSKDI